MGSAQPAEKAAHKTQMTFIKQAGIVTTSYQLQAAHQATLNDPASTHCASLLTQTPLFQDRVWSPSVMLSEKAVPQ